MLHILIQFHTQIFFWFYSFSQKYSTYTNEITFIANRIDNYILGLALLTFIYFILQSLERTSSRRFFFLFKEMIRIFVAVCFSWGFSYIIKMATTMPRPFLRFPDQVTPLFPYGGFDSFPSGHATLFMALTTMMMLHHRRIGYIFLFFTLLISVARIIAGVHFPIDILVGWIIGVSISLMVYRNFKI